MKDHLNVIVTLGLAILAMTWFVGQWYGSYTENRRHVDEFKDEVGQAMGDISEAMDDISEVMRDIRGMFDQIMQRLPSVPDPVADGRSPLTLTQLGRDISLDVDAMAWVALHIDEVRKQVAGAAPYDVQEHCQSYVTEDRLAEDGWLERAKDAAFRHGVVLASVQFVLALELRDALLSERVGA